LKFYQISFNIFTPKGVSYFQGKEHFFRLYLTIMFYDYFFEKSDFNSELLYYYIIQKNVK